MAGSEKVLLVDDDEALRESLREQLELEGEFVVSEAAGGEAALGACRAANYDLVILDIGLPDMDGREACRRMRDAGLSCPIIMLTGADTEADTILGLEAGADDYVTKPFRIGILLARMRAQLLRSKRSEEAVFVVGPYAFHPARRMLVDPEEGGRKIRLTEKEAAILSHLLKAGGEVTSRKTLLDQVWGYNAEVETHTVETHVYRLRQKIKRGPSSAEILVTEPGGYRLAP